VWERHEQQFLTPQGPVSAQEHVAVLQGPVILGEVSFAPIAGRMLGQEEVGMLTGPGESQGSIVLDDDFAQLEFRSHTPPGNEKDQATRRQTDRRFIRLIIGADPFPLKEVYMKMVIVRKCYPGLCATAFLAGLLAVPCRAGEVGDYLTQEGQLKEAVTVKTGAIQFLAPPGRVWIIEPSGDWTEKFTQSKGKLSAKQLAALAQHLATQEFNSLPPMLGYEAKDPDGTNRSGYRYVVIAFGKKEAAFNTQTGASRTDYLPKSGDPKAAAWSRFIALELVLADLLRISELKEEQGK
jgi:hypothetical protein